MALSSNLIILIELSHAEQVLHIPIPRKPTEMSIHKIFLDPSGRHLVITSHQGENWYLCRGWKKPRPLKSFNKLVIESIAWNKAALLSSSHSLSTKEFLLGTRNGGIFEAVLDAGEDLFKSQERYLQLLFSLPEKAPVTGIKFELFPPADHRHALVIVTTPSRIYQFTGTPDRRSDDGGRLFSSLFAVYRESAPSESLNYFSWCSRLRQRRDIRTTRRPATFGVAFLHAEFRPSSLVTQDSRLDDRLVFLAPNHILFTNAAWLSTGDLPWNSQL